MKYSECGSEHGKSFFDFTEGLFGKYFKDFGEDFRKFGKDFKKEFEGAFGADFIKSWPLMNVIDTPTGYRVEIAAPGLHKDAFKITLHEHHLKITADLETTLAEEEKYKRREFNFGKIKRSVELPDSADVDKIEAKYEDGILKVFVPKKQQEEKEGEREIKVS